MGYAMILQWIRVGQKRKLGANPVAAVDDDSHQLGKPVRCTLQIVPNAMEQRSRSMVEDGQGFAYDACSGCQCAKEMNLTTQKPLLPQKNRAVFGAEHVTFSGNSQLDYFTHILLVGQ